MSIDRTKIRWNGWGWAARKDDLAGREEVWTWLASELGMPALLATPPRPLEELTLPEIKLPVSDRETLSGIVGADQVRDDAHERAFHALGRSYHDLLRLRAGDLSSAPDAVVYPRASEEVLAVLAFAAKNRIAVVPYGGGTGTVGGVSGARGAFDSVIALDLSDMDRVIDLDPVSRTVTAEAGIHGPALEKALQAKGYTLGHTPQSFEFSTLGGWIAHRGAGLGAQRYGGAEDWLIAVKLATARGQLCGGIFPASATGPQLKDLAAGSEGIFGVITEATVRIRATPAVSDWRGYLFRDFASGAAAVRTAAQEGVAAATLRLSDAEETRLYRAYVRLDEKPSVAQRLTDHYLKWRGFGEAPCLLIAAFEGDAQTTALARQRFQAVASRYGVLAMGRAIGERFRRTRFLWPYVRDPMLDRGVGVETIETAARWSKLDAVCGAVRLALEGAMREMVPREGAHGVVMCHISHAYTDGAGLCFTVIFPRVFESEIAQWQKIKGAATEAILANGGTLSHHRGIGQDHLPWVQQEKGPLGMNVLRAIKSTLDPEGIMNPGKLLP